MKTTWCGWCFLAIIILKKIFYLCCQFGHIHIHMMEYNSNHTHDQLPCSKGPGFHSVEARIFYFLFIFFINTFFFFFVYFSGYCYLATNCCIWRSMTVNYVSLQILDLMEMLHLMDSRDGHYFLKTVPFQGSQRTCTRQPTMWSSSMWLSWSTVEK